MRSVNNPSGGFQGFHDRGRLRRRLRRRLWAQTKAKNVSVPAKDSGCLVGIWLIVWHDEEDGVVAKHEEGNGIQDALVPRNDHDDIFFRGVYVYGIVHRSHDHINLDIPNVCKLIFST
jgi:hypothetical protein